jgi:hypothetical protein
MPPYKPPGNPVGTTPTNFKTPPDARDTGGEYPNYYIKKTRSGHVMMMDDTLGSEHVTLQHRGGSMIQFTPDGRITFIAQSGQYSVVFGENRMLVTGAQDIVVEGMASLMVKGDYNTTVQGNFNTTVHGDMNITAKNLNQTIRGNMDTTAKNMTTKIEGSTEITTHGITTIASDGGLGLVSTGDAVAIGAAQNIGLKSGRKMMIEAGSSLNLKADGDVRSTAGDKSSIQGSTIAMDGDLIVMNEGSSDSSDPSVVSFKKPTTPNRET